MVALVVLNMFCRGLYGLCCIARANRHLGWLEWLEWLGKWTNNGQRVGNHQPVVICRFVES